MEEWKLTLYNNIFTFSYSWAENFISQLLMTLSKWKKNQIIFSSDFGFQT